MDNIVGQAIELKINAICPICLDSFWKINRDVKILPRCGHRYCETCLDNLQELNAQNRTVLQCRLCNQGKVFRNHCATDLLLKEINETFFSTVVSHKQTACGKRILNQHEDKHVDDCYTCLRDFYSKTKRSKTDGNGAGANE